MSLRVEELDRQKRHKIKKIRKDLENQLLGLKDKNTQLF
jgi:hypothetical protein